MADVKTIVKRAGTMVDRLLPPPRDITILIYHRVGGGTESEVDLSPEMFERRLEFLAEDHRVLSLDDAGSELTDESAAGWAAAGVDVALDKSKQRGVVITFDAGTTDFTDIVVPALDRHALPATLYVATRFVDESIDFPWGAPPTSRAELRDSLASGNVTIGSHTHAHWLLDRLDASSTNEDVDRSIELTESNLDHSPRHFAYPKAIAGSPSAEVAVRRRFDTASLALNRVNRPGSTDLHRLSRTPIQSSDGFETFKSKAAGGLRLEGELRSLSARYRYRGAER